MGVIAPIPVITTLRLSTCPSNHHVVRFAFGHSGEPRQGAGCDAVHEHRPDQMHRRPISDHRDSRPVPDVYNLHLRSFSALSEGPLHFHSLRNTLNVPKADRGLRPVHGHLREPPCGPVEPPRTFRRVDYCKRPVRGHLYYSTAVGLPLAKSHISVVREMCRPVFHLARNIESDLNRSANESLVHDFHPPSKRQRSKLQSTSGMFRHRCTGAQLVVTRNPRRRRATGLRATASYTVSASSCGVKPRITETTPSWRL